MQKETLNDRVQRILKYEATKKVWRTQFDSIEFREASALNQELYGLPFNRQKKCRCIEDFFSILRHQYQKHKFVIMDKKRFVVKPGKVVMNFALVTPLTEASSDEDAITLLKADPRNIKHFAHYPENWEEIVAGKAKLKEAEKNQKSENKQSDTPPADQYGKTIADMRQYAKDNGIDLGDAARKEDIFSAIDNEVKGRARYAERKQQLLADGWDDSDDVKFSKGDRTIDKGEVWASNDEEYQKLING